MENNAQCEAALRSMQKWLSHPCELGHRPRSIEAVGTFTLNGLTYYIFKFQPEAGDNWLVGVTGGFAPDGLEPCGHTFSSYQPYDDEKAESMCITMVNELIAYWKARAGVNNDPK